MTHKVNERGFTIVELLIVIVVIGILAALVVTTFTGIQQKARNTERETDIKAVHGQIEAYYAQNASYPHRDEVNSATWRSTNMKGLDPLALKDPKGTANALVGTVGANDYAYIVTGTGGAACTTAANDCTTYTLTATYEGSVGGATTYSKAALN